MVAARTRRPHGRAGFHDQGFTTRVSRPASTVKRHVPGAWFVLRSELAHLTGAEVLVLQGGTQAWIVAGLPLEQGETHLA